jgi:peptidoglycan/LPS O-acetylase OafA/YrhL
MKREIKPLTSIRGFAALWVVGLHFSVGGPAWVGAAFGYGYTAVDLFFILSGFILAHVYARLGRAGVPNFWLRRFFRLYPLHLVALALFVLVVTCGRWDLSGFATGPAALLASALLIHPFLPVRVLDNPPSWSIGIELFCYFLFPALIMLLRRARSRLMLLGLAVALLAAEYAVQLAYPAEMRGLGALLRGLIGFSLGMVMCRLGENREIGASLSSLASPGELAGLAGIFAANFLGRPELIPLFAALLLLNLYFDAGPIARAMHARWCLWLGRISFSIYLLHYPIIAAARTWLPARLMPLHGGLGRALWEIGLICVILGLSDLSCRFVETPCRQIPKRMGARRKKAQTPDAAPGASPPDDIRPVAAEAVP